MSRPVKGVIVAHGSLAAGLVGAARQISGAGEDVLTAISNDGHGPDGLLSAVADAAGEEPSIIFTDLPSGSCAFAANKLMRARPDTGIVTGVNLAILVDFVFNRELPLAELVERLAEKGRKGIVANCAEVTADADRSAPR